MSFKEVFTAGIIAFIMIILTFLLGSFIYQSETFTAKVTEINYYGSGGIWGSTKAEVTFDDGRVYSLYGIPVNLQENHTYLIEYRKPYLLKSPSIVILEKK